MNRIYHYSDVDMLMASRIVAESFRTNFAELSYIRSNWTEQYANELATRIENAIDTCLGIDAKKDLRGATARLVEIQELAKRDVAYFKLQIVGDYDEVRARRDEILKGLK